MAAQSLRDDYGRKRMCGEFEELKKERENDEKKEGNDSLNHAADTRWLPESRSDSC
jgi:hypothetical protein